MEKTKKESNINHILYFLMFLMIKTKVIKSEHLLQIYEKHYSFLAHNRIDLDYLKSSKARVFFKDDEKNMLGGYCINPGPNYRTFLPLNSTQLNQLNTAHDFIKNPPQEITCLWLDKNSQHARWSVYLFCTMFWDMLRMPRKTFIFGTHGRNIKNFFSLAFPQVIFYERLFVKTKNEECDFWIMKGSRYTFFKCLVLLSIIRLFGGKKRLVRFRLWLEKKHSKSSL